MTSKERKELTKNIENLASKQDAFLKAVAALETFKKESLVDLDTDIELKKNELSELAKKYENEVIDGKTSVDQRIKKYEYDAAVAIIEKQGEIPCFKEDIEAYKTTIAELKAKQDSELKGAVDSERKTAESRLRAVIENTNLKTLAEHAQLSAKVTQLESQVSVSNGVISNLQNELKCQRELTKDVAIAGKQGAIQQTIGKN
jgi:uncharacterized protein (DUF342 family)